MRYGFPQCGSAHGAFSGAGEGIVKREGAAERPPGKRPPLYCWMVCSDVLLIVMVDVGMNGNMKLNG